MRRVPEREAARAAGERFYHTGKPCRNGHVGKRYTGSGICAACAVINTLKSQAKKPEHPNRIAARAAGELHYSIGKPCRHGHDKKFVSNGICVQCSIQRCKEWNERNPGHMAAGARRRRAADPTGHRAEVKRWKVKNLDRVKIAHAAWKAANIEHVRSYAILQQNKRRVRLAKNGGVYTINDVKALRLRQNGICAGCRERKQRLEIDHILAVTRGGSNDPSNLQLLCRRCNASKGTRDMTEWAQQHGYLDTTCIT